MGQPRFELNCRVRLSCARNFRGFSVYTPAVERVVNNLTHRRNIRVHIHTIARGKMSQDTLSGNLQHRAGKLRKAPRLDVIESLKPLSQRQALVKIHD